MVKVVNKTTEKSLGENLRYERKFIYEKYLFRGFN